MTTAKAFVSGHDYRQDLSLEAGVYTLMVKVKSMYGDVVSFALRDEDGWKELSDKIYPLSTKP